MEDSVVKIEFERKRSSRGCKSEPSEFLIMDVAKRWTALLLYCNFKFSINLLRRYRNDDI